MLEEARAMAELVNQGWKPARTIIFCAWDGEEPGLLGSTEWAELHAADLKAHAAVYVNSDSNSRGYLRAEGSHSLESMLNGIEGDVKDPEKNIPVWKRNRARVMTGENAEARRDARGRADLRIAPLGSGSDYTVFIDHLGVASVDLTFAGEDPGGIYHSVYDDFFWYTHFADTKFVYCKALAQTAGLMVMRFADADLLPYEFTGFADTMHKYTSEVKKLLTDKQEEIRERNDAIDQGMYEAVSDPRRPMIAPKKEAVPPFINFAPLDNALADLDKSAARYGKACKLFSSASQSPLATQLTSLNGQLLQLERRLTQEDGLPRRPWFKHLIYAPGFYTGYGAKTLPGIREAIEEKRYDEADRQAARVAQTLKAYAGAIDDAAARLEALSGR